MWGSSSLGTPLDLAIYSASYSGKCSAVQLYGRIAAPARHNVANRGAWQHLVGILSNPYYHLNREDLVGQLCSSTEQVFSASRLPRALWMAAMDLTKAEVKYNRWITTKK